ncbi:MAG TPA: AI-2E family transporter [Mycobacteriales bacterium]|nr:AI-2E family transporter [Mycobacteriales bacterium]
MVTAKRVTKAPVVDERFDERLRRVVLAAAVGIFALLAVLWALERLRNVLLLVVLSLFLGFAIEPGVNRLARRGWSRTKATSAAFALLSVPIGLFSALLGTVVVRQVAAIVDGLPGYARTATDFLEDRLGIDLSQADVTGAVGQAGQVGRVLTRNAFGFGATVLGLLFQLLTVATLTFYFAKDGPKMRRAVCRLLPAGKQREVLRAWDIAIDATASYVIYRVTLAVLSAVVHVIGFSLLDVPSAVALGLWVGAISQFIPAVGVYLAGVLPVVVALTQSPRTSLYVLILVVVYQQIENYLISPPLSSRTMKVHPAIGFIAALAGLALFGPIGALLALPVVATAQSFASSYVVRHPIVDNDLLDDA